jgi:hypothetical protein
LSVPTLAVPVTEEGITVPRATALALGLRAGHWARLEVEALPSSEELRASALRYVIHHLGDGVYPAEPVWIDDGWQLGLRVKGREGVYGHLVLTPEGEVVQHRSSTRSELLEALGG